MPEGHTIHRIAIDQKELFVGDALEVTSPQGRFRTGAKKLSGKRLEDIEAWGKHLFYHWKPSGILHIHLGLYGKFRVHKKEVPEPRGQVRLRVIGRRAAFDLNGPNCCELITRKDLGRICERLGPDPLSPHQDLGRTKERILSSRAAIGSLLLNQSVIAGVGNVYRAEVLYLLHLCPNRPGNSLSGEDFEQLWQLLSELMEIGVRYNRIITVDPKNVGKSRSRMNRAERLNIYKKTHCPKCGGEVTSWILGGRKIYACRSCQA